MSNDDCRMSKEKIRTEDPSSPDGFAAASREQAIEGEKKKISYFLIVIGCWPLI